MKVKKVSKRHKNSWRKFIDDSDVDGYFENKRLEERLGTPFELREDADLFKIDRKPVTQTPSCSSKNTSLKCLQALENTSAVPDPLIKRNKIRTKEQRQHPISKKKEEIRLRRGILKKKEITRLQKYFYKRVSCFEQKQKRRITVDKDIWSSDSVVKPKISKLKEWFNDTTHLHTIKNTSDLKIESNYVPQKTKTVISSFEIPHPGISYNPTFKDHLDLANSIVKKEIETQKKEKHLDRTTQKFYKQISIEKNEENWIKEMSEGLPFHNENECKNTYNEHSDNEDCYKAVNPAVNRQMKKTIKQRKKEQRLKRDELKRKELKDQRKKALDICRVKHIMKEIINEDSKAVNKSLRKRQNLSKKSEMPRRTGKNLFKEEDLNITQIPDLTGSLREIIPQGGVLRSKFINMQKRSLIEVTKPQFKNKKKKKKKYRLASHRPESK